MVKLLAHLRSFMHAASARRAAARVEPQTFATALAASNVAILGHPVTQLHGVPLCAGLRGCHRVGFEACSCGPVRGMLQAKPFEPVPRPILTEVLPVLLHLLAQIVGILQLWIRALLPEHSVSRRSVSRHCLFPALLLLQRTEAQGAEARCTEAQRLPPPMHHQAGCFSPGTKLEENSAVATGTAW